MSIAPFPYFQQLAVIMEIPALAPLDFNFYKTKQNCRSVAVILISRSFKWQEVPGTDFCMVTFLESDGHSTGAMWIA